MVAAAADSAKNLALFRLVICVWLWRLYVVMIRGAQLGPEFYNIVSHPRVTWMVTHSAIF